MNQNNISLEKVINGLDCCLEGLCEPCEYRGSKGPGGCKDELMCDALTLLKAQEPVKPRERIYHFFADRYCYDVSPRMVTCGACGECLPTGDATTKYCPNCGRAVKWND